MAKLTGVSRDWVQLAIEENTRNLGGGGVTVSENVSQIGGVAIAGGQSLMAASLPVVIASDQSAVPVSAASLPLPTGAATAALQPSLGTAAAPSTNVITTQLPASTTVSSTVYETSHVLKASAGKLMGLIGYNSKATAQFIQVHNSTTVPADTGVPTITFTVAASSNFSLDLGANGIPFTTGISVSNSSTGATKTIGSADCFFTGIII